MYKTFNLNDSIPSKYLKYKLCLVKRIPETVLGVSSEYKGIIDESGLSVEEYMELPDRKYVNLIDSPNPDFVAGERELVGYFLRDVPLNLDDEWNDDHDDLDEILPKDHIGRRPVSLVAINFSVDSMDYILPNEWYIDKNCPFSIDDVNAGAVAWIFDAGGKEKTSIFGRDTMFSFIKKLAAIKSSNPENSD